MSSIQREVGETLRDIYLEIPENLDHLSIEEMKLMFRGIKSDSKEKYAEYAYHMGWADSEEEAIQNLTTKVIDRSKNEERVPISHSLFIVSKWFSQKRNIAEHFDAFVLEESEKAYLTREYDWIPKSQIESKQDIHFKMDPPLSACVSWFNDNFDVGDRIGFSFDGGLGGHRYVEGIINRFEFSELYMNDNSYLMECISQVIKFVKKEFSF
jgi:hypothetical protein